MAIGARSGFELAFSGNPSRAEAMPVERAVIAEDVQCNGMIDEFGADFGSLPGRIRCTLAADGGSGL